MNNDKWGDVVEKIKSGFAVEAHSIVPHVEFDKGKIETIIFASPMGRMKIIRTTTPRVLDRKTVYSNRIGGKVAVQYEYSDSEMVDTMRIFRWDENREEWATAQLEMEN